MDDRLTTLLKDVRDKYDAAGRTTWLLFPCQLLTFFIGIAFLIFGMWYQIGQPAHETDALKNLTERVSRIDEKVAVGSARVNTLATDYIRINELINKAADRTRKLPQPRRRARKK